MIEDSEVQGPEKAEDVADVADAWEAALTETEKIDPTVSVSGKKRSTRSSGAPVAVDVGPKVNPSDVAPVIKAVGAISTRLAEVSPLTEDEVTELAEPSARLLEIVAPDTPPWMIPAMTLSARLGDVVAARRDEFRENRPKATPDKPGQGDEPSTELADEF